VVGLAGVARPASEQDHRVRDVDPRAARQQVHQVALDLDRIVLRGEREALRDASDVRVDEDAFGLRRDVCDHDVRRLPRHAGERRELVDRERDLAAEVLDDLSGRADDRLRLLPEEPGGINDLLDVGRVRGGERLGIGVGAEELRRDLVDRFVGALGGQDCRDEQLERLGVVE
jgi:hypothetical protein